MKIRTGFVSNSSSSSFIIEISESKPCKHCGRKDQDILEMIRSIDHDGYSDTMIDAEGKEAVLQYINDNYSVDETKKSLIAKVMEVDILDNKNVAIISIAYSQDFLREILKTSPNVRVLYGE